MPARKILFRRLTVLTVFLIFIASLNCTSDSGKPTTEPIKKSIAKNNPAEIKESLKLKKPTIGWQKLMNEGEDFYTPGDIIESDKLLDKYLYNLAAAKDTSDIWKAVEEVVTGFDKLNILSNDFIQTAEREELAEFIQVAAEAYGLKYHGDITEQWRMEW